MKNFRDNMVSKQATERKNLFLVQRRIEILKELGFEEDELSLLKDKELLLSKAALVTDFSISEFERKMQKQDGSL